MSIEQAGHWAERVLADPRTAAIAAADAAFGRAMYRVRERLAFVEPDATTNWPAATRNSSPSGERDQTWADFAHVLLNVKEFIFIP